VKWHCKKLEHVPYMTSHCLQHTFGWIVFPFSFAAAADVSRLLWKYCLLLTDADISHFVSWWKGAVLYVQEPFGN
jgi:hypothetical protein